MKFYFLIFTVVLLTFSNLLIAQGGEKHCYTDEIFRQQLKDHPELLQIRAQLEQFTQQYQKSHPNEVTTAVKIIPVVFHVLHNYGPENISDAQIMDQVRIWNEDFQKRNADTNAIIPPFKSIAANCGLEFRLATMDQNGNCTNGIDRIPTMLTYSADDDSKLNPWPSNMYLNIWTAASLANSGAAAYAYYPGTAPSGKDGVLSLSNYIGSIGTGNYGLARVISHETGHYLNLQHPWGDNNNAAVSCGDDYVNDTPITKGWINCPSATAPSYSQWIYCNSGIVENVQNFMDYSYCGVMFTQGQSSRMQVALNSSFGARNNLWTSSNLIATGTADPYEPSLCSPIADFNAVNKVVCIGTSIQFKDLSYNGHPTSWNWSFPGGTPSTSTDSFPIIQYNTPGVYSVTLTSSNSSGSSLAKTKTSYIIVSDSTSNPVPFTQDFESATFPPGNYYVINPMGGTPWQHATTAGYSSSKSMRANNYNGLVDGAMTEFITPSYNFTNVDSPAVKFYVAHAHKTSDTTRADALKVYYSLDCGVNWTLRYNKSGSSLVTASPRSTNSFFNPGTSTNNWRQDALGAISILKGKPNVRFKFQCVSANGNNIYVDDININGKLVGMDEINNPVSAFEIYPNPAKDQINIDFSLEVPTDLKAEIYDLTGRRILDIFKNHLPAGEHNFPVNLHLQDGVYLVKISDGSAARSRRVIILH